MLLESAWARASEVVRTEVDELVDRRIGMMWAAFLGFAGFTALFFYLPDIWRLSGGGPAGVCTVAGLGAVVTVAVWMLLENLPATAVTLVAVTLGFGFSTGSELRSQMTSSRTPSPQRVLEDLVSARIGLDACRGTRPASAASAALFCDPLGDKSTLVTFQLFDSKDSLARAFHAWRNKARERGWDLGGPRLGSYAAGGGNTVFSDERHLVLGFVESTRRAGDGLDALNRWWPEP